MADRHATLLFSSALVRLADVRCHAPRSGCGPTEYGGVAQLIVPRRGVFQLHRRGESIVADARTAVLIDADHEYRVSHPADGGDDCTVLVYAPEVVDEALGIDGVRHGLLRPATQLGARLLAAAATRGAADPLETEEAAVTLLGALARDLGARSSTATTGAERFRRQRVEEVRSLLASRPTARWPLAEIARAVHCSPFHLARTFKAVTGETLARYVVRLRLALALQRLAGGETDLARLAADLGFAHHSHFSARFRAAFGTTPTGARELLARGTPSDVSTIVTAPGGSSA